MTTKRTHGPCTCKPHAEDDARDATGIVRAHLADCPSLYPAQQEPDALTRLVRYVRDSTMHEVEKEEALSLISEAREEQRRAKNEGLKQAAAKVTDATQCSCNPYAPCTCDWSGRLDGLADDILAMLDPEP